MGTSDPRQAARAFAKQRNFGSLDAIRGLSIIAVLLHHAEPDFEPLPGFSRGFLGVDIFFAMSGFLIVTLVLRERDRTGTVALGKFWKRRILRLFPLYYATLVFVGVLSYVLPSTAFFFDRYLATIPYVATFTVNWTAAPPTVLFVTWSLAAEVQFYLTWPVIEKLLPKLALPILVLFLAYNQAVQAVLVPMPFGLDRISHEMLHITYAPILYGILLAHLLHREGSFVVVYRALGHRWSAPALLVLIAVIVNIPNADIGGWHRATLDVLFTALVGAVVVREDHGLARLCHFKPLERLGVVSYGIYLLHLVPISLVPAALGKVGLRGVPMLNLLIGGGISWVMAELSFRYIEAPFLKKKEKVRATA